MTFKVESETTWYTVTEAATLLGMHPETAYRLLRRGNFPVPAYRLKRYWRIPKAGVDVLVGKAS